MRCVITSDLHLGKRQFAATEDGRNSREQDIERAWAAAVDHIVREQPDLVLIGGDVTDSVRPSMHAVRSWQQGVRRIVRETPAEVVAILGNHDGSRTREALSPVIVVDGEPRVHVVSEPKRLRLRLAGERVGIACIPFSALQTDATYRMEPDSWADYQVLLMHAAVRSSAAPGLLPSFYSDDTSIDIARDADAWGIIALGDYHTFAELVPGRCVVYPGSIERTGSGVWGEPEPKGIVAYHTDTCELRFLEVPTRPVSDYDLGDFDLPPGVGAADANACLGKMLAYPHLRDAVVRFKVDAFPRDERDAIDWSLVRQLKQHAMHFQLNLRYAQRESVSLGDRREARGRTIEEDAADYLGGEPDDVRSCALQYLGGEAA